MTIPPVTLDSRQSSLNQKLVPHSPPSAVSQQEQFYRLVHIIRQLPELPPEADQATAFTLLLEHLPQLSRMPPPPPPPGWPPSEEDIEDMLDGLAEFWHDFLEQLLESLLDENSLLSVFLRKVYEKLPPDLQPILDAALQALEDMLQSEHEDYERPRIDTNGWDTVSVVHIDYINSYLAEQGPSIKSFSASDPDDDLGEWSLQGTFNAWQVIGGANSLINFNLPISDGSFILNNHSIDLTGFSVHIQMQLEFVDAESQPDDAREGIIKELKVAAKPNPQSESDFIHILEILNADQQQPSPTVEGLLIGAFENYIQQNADQIDDVFATINLANQLAAGDYPWLMPTVCSYAIQDNTLQDEEEITLSILSLTKEHEDRNPENVIDPYSIPKNSRAGFLISAELLLTHMIGPALKKHYNADLTYQSADRQLINPNGFNLPKVEHDGEKYSLYVQPEDFKVELDAGKLRMRIQTETKISAGIWSYTITECEFICRYNTVSEQIEFELTGEPNVQSWTEKSGWVTLLQILAGFLGAIITVITGGVAGFAVGAIVGAVTGILSSIPNFIQAAASGDFDEHAEITQALFQASLSSISWKGIGEFNLNNARFADCLQLGASPIIDGPGKAAGNSQ